jgi:NAD(P)-dependent dehydrogenase (short-subunit alcohol dehydrogenase family)
VSVAERVAVVTGGSLGIGAAVVRRLAADGAAVVFCGHEPGSVAATTDELRSAGLAVTRIRHDGGVETVAADPTAHLLCHPTNLAFGPDGLPVAANLGRWHLTAIDWAG